MDFIKYIFISLRPKQWIKNCFVFAALIFVREFTNTEKIGLTVLTFLIFCIGSSAVYLINDLADMKSDRQHPTKRFRPIAAGKISPRIAGMFIIIFTLSALAGSYLLRPLFSILIGGYLLLNILYSFWLKKVVIIDVLIIASGFVLRVIAGALVLNISFSPWLVFCTFFLTLFLAISKRKSELLLNITTGARTVLGDYSLQFLDQMNTVVLPLTLITYTFYTFSSEHSKLLMLTVPVVLFGLFRYLYLIDHNQIDSDGPTDILFMDRQLQATIAVWIVMIIIILSYAK